MSPRPTRQQARAQRRLQLEPLEDRRLLSVMSVDNPRQFERNGIGSNDLIFRVRRTGDTSLPASVDFATTEGSATAGIDFHHHSGSLQFGPGVTERLIRVTILRDDRVEPDEDFFVELSNPQGASLSTFRGRGLIVNDDSQLSVNDVTLVEGDTGGQQARFTVTLDPPAAAAVRVDFHTVSGSARAGEDFTAAAGELVFTPTQTHQFVDVPIVTDVTAEPNESFELQLFNARGGELTKSRGLALILDDDADAAQLAPQLPLGSLVYTRTVNGSLEASGDAQTHSLHVAPGSTVALVMDADASELPHVTLRAPDGRLLAEGQEGVGRHVLGPFAADATGEYRAEVTSPLASNYRLQWILNAHAEQETNASSENLNNTNDSFADAEDITASFLQIGPHARRGAVLGQADGSPDTVGPDTFGYVAKATPFEFEDISETGTAVLGGTDDASFHLTAASLAGFSFDFYGERYHDLYLNSNGSISLGAADSSFENSQFLTPAAPATIAPLWDDLDLRDSGAVYWQLRGEEGQRRLIVQWHEVAYFDSRAHDPISFQAILYESDSSLEFHYADLAGSHPVRNEGATAAVGIQSSEGMGLLVADPSTSSNLVAPSSSLRISAREASGPETPTSDFYRFSVEEGEVVDVTVTGLSPGPLSIDLFDASRTQLASGVPQQEGAAIISGLQVSEPGELFVRVDGRAADYNLLVTRNARLEEGLETALPATSPTESRAGFGYLSSPAPQTVLAAGNRVAQPAAAEPPIELLGPAESNADSTDFISAPNRIIVRYAKGAGQQERLDLLRQHGGQVLEELPLIDGAVVAIANPDDIPAAVRSWTGDDRVIYAEPDYLVHSQVIPNDPSFAELWGLHNVGQSGGTADADIDAPEAWDRFRGSSSVVVASIDSGVDYNHPDLATNMWKNPGEIAGDGIDNDGNGFVDDVFGIDTSNGDSDPMDDTGHGTHTAGTIGAVGDNDTGIVGVGWDVSIMALKFLSSEGTGTISGAIGALNYMTMMKTEFGVNVVASNNSWSGSGPSRALEDAIRASNDAGIMFVTSAGNNRRDNDAQPEYPGSFDLPGVITVAATDRNDRLAAFSSYGATSVDLAAPGVSILSTRPNARYGRLSGTSMASPHVAGAVGMLMAYNSEASLEEVKAAILNGVDVVDSLTARVLTGGRLNLANSLDLVGDRGDFFHFPARVGDSLRFSTNTPSDALLEVPTTLDPSLELYSSDGRLLAVDHNGAPDGRNAVLEHLATETGQYSLRVFARGGQGEYQIVTEGATATATTEPLTLAVSTPSFGQPLSSTPRSVQLDFSSEILLPGVEASDLVVGGIEATSVEAVDGDSLLFTLPPLEEGQHSLQTVPGAFRGLNGSSSDPLLAEFTIDATEPQLTSLFPQPNQVLTAGPVTIVLSSNEPLNSDSLDSGELTLTDSLGNIFSPESVTYDEAPGQVEIHFANLPDETYQFRVTKEFVRDLAGNSLAEPEGGSGHLRFSFSVDEVQRGASPFQRVSPLGSLIFASQQNQGRLHSSDDVDRFEFATGSDRTVSAIVQPVDSQASLRIAIVSSDGTIIAERTASSPGEAVSIAPQSLPSGQHRLQVEGATTSYSAEIWINTWLAQAADSTASPPVRLEPSLTAVPQIAVVGTHSPSRENLESIVWGVQPSSGQILLVDPTSGRQLHSFPVPDVTSPTDTAIGLSLANAGTELLYINSDVDPTRLYRLDPITGAVRSVETVSATANPAGGLSFQAAPQSAELIYSATMETDPGWALDPGWEYGRPQGGGTANRDPIRGFTGTHVVGYDLQGDYPDNLGQPSFATTPVIDASEFQHLALSFRRWLGVEQGSADKVSIEVSPNGDDWFRIWSNPRNASIVDHDWQLEYFDISAIADGQTSVQIRWGMGPTNDDIPFPGWNIDDVTVRGIRQAPPAVLISQPNSVLQQAGYSENSSVETLPIANTVALGGDDQGRQFAYQTQTGIVEYSLATPTVVLNTLLSPTPDVEALAYDGASVYVASAGGELFTLDPDTGTTKHEVNVAGGGLFGLAATRNPDSARVIFHEDFDGPAQTFTFDDDEASLWHITTGRRSDGQDNHSGPYSAYFGKAEKDGGGGNYDTGEPVAGNAFSPLLSLPPTTPLTLSFNSLVEVNERSTTLSVLVDDGSDLFPLVSTADGNYTSSTSDTWRPTSLDLSTFAGRDIRLVFSLEAADGQATGEGWYLDDVLITQGPSASEFLLPDVDEYTVEVQASPLEVVLDEEITANLRPTTLELFDSSGSRVARAVSQDCAGSRRTHLSFVPATAGEYTIRTSSTTQGAYRLWTSQSLIPHVDHAISRPLTDDAVLGYVAPVSDPGRLFVVEINDLTKPATIHELSPTSGSIINSFPTPDIPGTFPFGVNLAFDGEYLWYNSGAPRGTNVLHRLHPDTGALLESRRPTGGESFQGLARVGQELFGVGEVIQVYDVSAPGLPATRTLPWLGGTVVGLAGDDASGTLLAITQGDSGKLYELSATTGEVLRSGDVASIAAEQGLAVAGDEIFISEAAGDEEKNYVTVYDRETFRVLRRWTLPLASGSFVAGLGGDGYQAGTPATFPVFLRAGDRLIAHTETPLDGSDGPALNQLDPQLALHNSDNQTVATARSGLEDGRNTQLDYTAAITGWYRLELSAEVGRGEYLLRTRIEPTTLVAGRTFLDGNSDGLRNPGEDYLNGWTITLLDSLGNTLQTQLTRDIDLNGDNLIDPQTERGWYRFTVEPGNYTIRQSQLNGWNQTAPGDPLISRAFELDQQFDFYTDGDFYFNWGGADEKWLQAAAVPNSWFYITPNGSVWEWDGTSGNPLGSPLAGTLRADLTTAYYANPGLLIDATPPSRTHTVNVATGDQSIDLDFGTIPAPVARGVIGAGPPTANRDRALSVHVSQTSTSSQLDPVSATPWTPKALEQLFDERTEGLRHEFEELVETLGELLHSSSS